MASIAEIGKTTFLAPGSTTLLNRPKYCEPPALVNDDICSGVGESLSISQHLSGVPGKLNRNLPKEASYAAQEPPFYSRPDSDPSRRSDRDGVLYHASSDGRFPRPVLAGPQ